MSDIIELPIKQIEIDGGTQSRACLDSITLGEYADAMTNGVTFPPVVVFYDGSTYWLADGFHRVSASLGILKTLPAEVKQGTRRDAVLYSVGANADHGVRRTKADKRRAVMRLLEDEEWREWSNVKIAEACRVSEFLVRTIRDELGLSSIKSKIERKVERNGTIYTQNTANIGKHPIPAREDIPTPRPYAPQHTTATTFEQSIPAQLLQPVEKLESVVTGSLTLLKLKELWREASPQEKRDFLAWIK